MAVTKSTSRSSSMGKEMTVTANSASATAAPMGAADQQHEHAFGAGQQAKTVKADAAAGHEMANTPRAKDNPEKPNTIKHTDRHSAQLPVAPPAQRALTPEAMTAARRVPVGG